MTPERRDELILSLEKGVRYCAFRAWETTPPSVDIGDLLAAAWMGAIKAVDSFDPERGVTLHTYARPRIAGHILDYLRECDPLDRGHRRQVKAGEAVDPVHVRADLCSNKEYKSSTFNPNKRLGLEVAAPDQTPAANAALDIETLFARAEMSDRNKDIVRSHYLREEPLHAISAKYRVGVSRASQICKAGIAALRAAA